MRQLLALLPLLASCTSISPLEEVINELATDEAVVLRPLASASQLGLEASSTGGTNRVLLAPDDTLPPADSWDELNLEYTSRSSLALDFAHYLTIGAAAGGTSIGMVQLRNVSVRRIADPIVAVQAARVEELLGDPTGTAVVEVFRLEIAAAQIAFDATTAEDWKLEPRQGVAGIEVVPSASGDVIIRSSGTGKGLVIGAVPAWLAVSRLSIGEEQGGRVHANRKLGVSIELQETSEDGNFSAIVSRLGERLTEEFAGLRFSLDYIPVSIVGGRAVYLQVARSAPGSYVYSFWEYSAVWR